MIYTSENLNEIGAALAKAHKVIEAAVKTKKNILTKSGVFTMYAGLDDVIEAIKKPLAEQGISFIQGPCREGALDYVDTRLLHESGQYIGCVTPIIFSSKDNPQAYGSGVTYAKRYALQSLVGLPSEDDDGKAAKQKGEQAQDVPPPNEKEKAFLDALFADLADSAPDGMRLSEQRLTYAMYKIKKGYPTDLDNVSNAAEHFRLLMKDLCVPMEYGPSDSLDNDFPG
jgi:hypothetical protein